VTLSSEAIKPVALSIVELCLGEAGQSVSQSVSQLVEDSVKYNKISFIAACLKGLGLILRHFWAWLCLTNAAKLLKRKCETGFWVIFLGSKSQTSMILNLQLLPYCMILFN